MSRSHRRSAYLLSQLGLLSASRFAELVAPEGLTPRDAGVLRLLGQNPGISQRALSDRLGTAPSATVAMIDALQDAGYVSRSRSAVDRRNHELTLTESGQSMLQKLAALGREHERVMVGDLTDVEQEQLDSLLQKLCAVHGLDPQVHPGYRRSRESKASAQR